VSTEDVLAQGLGVQLLGLHVVTGEAILRVRDEDAAIRSALHHAEHARAGGGTGQADVKKTFEGATLLAVDFGSFRQLVLAISFDDALELLIQLQLLQGAACKEESGGVCRGPVGEAMLDAVGFELVGVGSSEDLVAGDLGGDDLADDVAVGEANNKTILGCVVLVLGLGDEALASVVVGLTRPASLVLRLEATEVRAVLD